MVYKPNVPQSTDIIAKSQRDFLGNNDTLYNVWGKPPEGSSNVGDHVPLDESDENLRGKHKRTTHPEQSSDPTTAANEASFYSKEQNSVSELFYYRNGDAAGNQLTDTGQLTEGGLTLRAFVLFDFQGNIIEVNRVDGDGDVSKVPVSFNVTDVTPNQPLVNGVNALADWDINFTNALPTANYIWSLQSFNDNLFSTVSSLAVQVQPYNSATYSDTVQTTRFRVVGQNLSSSFSNPVIGRLDRILFQAYTVAQ